MKKKGLTKSYINKQELTQKVVDLLKKNAGRKYSMKSVFRELGMSSHPERMLCVDVLKEQVN